MYKFYNLKNMRFRICLYGLLISTCILLVVVFATDGLLGDKEFSEYTESDWENAMFPLIVIIISGAATVIFTLILSIPLFILYPALVYYITKKKFNDIEPGSAIIVFDHHEFKRACCQTGDYMGLQFSVKEFNLNKRDWVVLEEGRICKNKKELMEILKNEYGYDDFKFYLDMFA